MAAESRNEEAIGSKPVMAHFRASSLNRLRRLKGKLLRADARSFLMCGAVLG